MVVVNIYSITSVHATQRICSRMERVLGLGHLETTTSDHMVLVEPPCYE
jgi:hypothetical protein